MQRYSWYCWIWKGVVDLKYFKGSFTETEYRIWLVRNELDFFRGQQYNVSFAHHGYKHWLVSILRVCLKHSRSEILRVPPFRLEERKPVAFSGPNDGNIRKTRPSEEEREEANDKECRDQYGRAQYQLREHFK